MKPSVAVLLIVAIAACHSPFAHSADKPWSVVGCDRMDVGVLKGDTPAFILQNNLIGPDWKSGRIDAFATAKDNVRTYVENEIGFFVNWFDQKPMPGLLDLRYELRASGSNSVTATYTCKPEMATTFGLPGKRGENTVSIGPCLPKNPYFKGGKVELLYTSGTSEMLPMPPPSGQRRDVKELIVTTANGESHRLSFQPPILTHLDHGEIRVFASAQVGAGQEFVQQYTLQTPAAATFEAANRLADTASWYTLNFEQVNDFSSPSALGMETWMDIPAGKHGWLQMKGKDFVFENGTPAKFWGINICNARVAPDKENADRWADRCAKSGANFVRFHKFLGMGRKQGINDPEDGTKLNEEYAARFDYFSARLASKGVYYGWSQFYAYKLSPADKDRVLAFDELIEKGNAHFKGSTSMMVNFAPDLQDLHIRTLVNLLNRKNTVTGTRYADDRALAYIEIQNEDSIFFPGLDSMVKKTPTYYALMKRQFSEWLAKHYGSEETWRKQWGANVRPNEKLVDGNVDPFADPIYDLKQPSRRVLDVYAYLYDAQTSYYQRVTKAIRDTGYGGAICGSCWQTATFLGHLYNVRSDREVGFIDRHNYGGGEMLTRPGGGLLSAGLQQVADRPYSFSEWSGGSVFGGMEMVPVIGFIGMGVQGWDISAQFASDSSTISQHRTGGPSCDRFMSFLQYPAISRALYRGDLKEVAPVGIRRVSIPALATGTVGFTEQFSLLGGANIKEFAAAVPQEALGAGPVVLEFHDGPVDKVVEDTSAAYIDREKKKVTSASGQVKWDYSERGFFTVDTPGTQAVIGYAGGAAHRLTDATVETRNPLALVYISARDAKETIANAKSLIITTAGRVTPRGALLDDVSQSEVQIPVDVTRLKELETVEYLAEPVTTTITLKRKGDIKVYPLDHGGKKAPESKTIPVKNGTFTLDGAKHKTPFYLVEIKD